MNPSVLIEKLFKAEVLSEALTDIPDKGATEAELVEAENRLGISINNEYKEFLKIWNGANLDVIRPYSTNKLYIENGNMVFSDDPSGFIYSINENGEIICFDTDGGETKTIASSFNDFFYSYLFGSRSHEFMGEEWKEELKDAGIST